MKNICNKIGIWYKLRRNKMEIKKKKKEMKLVSLGLKVYRSKISSILRI